MTEPVTTLMDEDGMILFAHNYSGDYVSHTDWRALVDEWQSNRQRLPQSPDIRPQVTYLRNDKVPGAQVPWERAEKLENSSPPCQTPTSYTLLPSNSNSSPSDIFIADSDNRCSGSVYCILLLTCARARDQHE